MVCSRLHSSVAWSGNSVCLLGSFLVFISSGSSVEGASLQAVYCSNAVIILCCCWVHNLVWLILWIIVTHREKERNEECPVGRKGYFLSYISCPNQLLLQKYTQGNQIEMWEAHRTGCYRQQGFGKQVWVYGSSLTGLISITIQSPKEFCYSWDLTCPPEPMY
jgi:hypothetical protein